MIVRLRNIKRVRSKGHVYFYHRPTMTRLAGEYGSPEFIDSWKAAEAKHSAWQPVTGTLGGLFAEYRASPHFKNLAPRTRDDYHAVMNFLAKLDSLALAEITTANLMRLRDKTKAQRGWHFANYVMQVISCAFAWGRPYGLTSDNPAKGVPKLRRPRDLRKMNSPWSREELAAVLAEASPPMRAAIALGAYVGLREGDVVRLAWSAYQGGCIRTTHGKTGFTVTVPAHTQLRQVLDQLPKRAVQIVTGERGRPLTLEGFKTNFFKLMRRMEREGKIARRLTFHGLRHTAATMLSDAGCTLHETKAVTGHKSLASVARYSDEADRERNAAAAIAKLEGTNTGRGRGKP